MSPPHGVCPLLHLPGTQQPVQKPDCGKQSLSMRHGTEPTASEPDRAKSSSDFARTPAPESFLAHSFTTANAGFRAPAVKLQDGYWSHAGPGDHTVPSSP